MSNDTQSPSGNFGNTPVPSTPDPRSARVNVVSSAPLSQAPASAPAGHAALHITLREGGVMERTLTTGDTRIGKGSENELILGDAAISSNHALIRFDGRTHTLIDVGSRNGTYLNNTRIIAPMPLKTGDTVKLGHCAIVFRSLLADAAAPAGQTLTLSATEILGASPAAPPPPSAPPMPTTSSPPSEDTLARALVNNKLIAMADMERVQKNLQGRRLYRVLVTEKLATELGLRDLMSRTFNLQLADLRSAEMDVPIAQKLNPTFLRDKLMLPLTGLPNELTLALADPTDQAALEELKKRAGKPINLRLATGSEIVAKLDAQFTPRLIGVLPSGEKLEIPINQAEISIGKGPHNRVVLNDATVSTTHATVLARDGGFSLVDLGSSNGTFINSQRLGSEARTLQHGDKIQLGKVLLTFRNPGETVENKTARLSLDALEEIRRKAGLITGSVPAATAGAILPPKPAPAPAQASEDEEEKKRKKKEKEQKEKEKNSLTSASNLSRIIAQVMGALIAIAGPIVLYWLGVFGGNNPGANDPGGGKGLAANATVAFTPQRVWEDFKSGGIFGKKIEASGAAFMPGTNGLVVVDDGRQGELVWMPLNELGKQAGDLKAIPLNTSFIDAEAVTYGGGHFYVITSQSDPASATGKSLMRFSLNPQTQTINEAQADVISDLRSFLLQNVPEIATRGAAPGLQGGLNIEGLAYDPNNERLLLGLRSPFVGPNAVLVPLRLTNPLQPLSLNNLRVDTPSVITLALEGQGVRDITYDAFKKMFLIVSGAPETEKKTDFGLWEWSGNATEPPRKLAVLDEKYKPEGITGVTLNGQNFVMVMGDADSYMRLDYQK